jgi:hypothetical protein
MNETQDRRIQEALEYVRLLLNDLEADEPVLENQKDMLEFISSVLEDSL